MKTQIEEWKYGIKVKSRSGRVALCYEVLF